MTWPGPGRPSPISRTTGTGGVALLGVSTYITTTGRRIRGYRSAVRDNGLDDSPELIFVSSESPEDAAAELVKHLDMPDPPTAARRSRDRCRSALA
jgi:DNA-binding LacI/PurR family transcriptional regulator